MRILCGLQTQQNIIYRKIVAILWYDLHVLCAIFSDNFRNEFQLSVPLNTVPSVKMMADNDAIPVCMKAKGRGKMMAELHSHTLYHLNIQGDSRSVQFHCGTIE